MAGKHDTLTGHFYAVNHESKSFAKPESHDINYIIERNRPYLQVVGFIEPKPEEDVPDLTEQDKKDLDAIDSGKEVEPEAEQDKKDLDAIDSGKEVELEAEPDNKELSDEDKAAINKEVDNALQDVFSDFIDSGYYGEPALIELDSGWVVHYWPHTEEYPPAMCISAGDRIIESSQASPEHEKYGTIVGQAFDAAAQVVLIALAKKWQSLHIVTGTDMMQWAAWAVAEKNGLEVVGYDASKRDEDKAERIAPIIEKSYSHNPAIANVPGISPSGTKGSSDKDDKDK